MTIANLHAAMVSLPWAISSSRTAVCDTMQCGRSVDRPEDQLEIFVLSGWMLEASTGIEPVYTDLQSRKSVSENNGLRVQNTP
ncbi:MAG: hypothetical protein MRY69_06135 [Phaeobacter italicus]|nr:hypothetical protein [Phaeobacter italicus]